jgi:hypothetical protein
MEQCYVCKEQLLWDDAKQRFTHYGSWHDDKEYDHDPLRDISSEFRAKSNAVFLLGYGNRVAEENEILSVHSTLEGATKAANDFISKHPDCGLKPHPTEPTRWQDKKVFADIVLLITTLPLQD